MGIASAGNDVQVDGGYAQGLRSVCRVAQKVRKGKGSDKHGAKQPAIIHFWTIQSGKFNISNPRTPWCSLVLSSFSEGSRQAHSKRCNTERKRRSSNNFQYCTSRPATIDGQIRSPLQPYTHLRAHFAMGAKNPARLVILHHRTRWFGKVKSQFLAPQ